MVIVVENEHSEASLNPRRGCLHIVIPVGKDINATILLPVNDKIVGQAGPIKFSMETGLGQEKLWIQNS